MEVPRCRRLGWIVLVLGAIVADPGRTIAADLIYFRDGRAATLPAATVEGDRIFVPFPDGRVELRNDEIVKRVPGFWPPDEWESRRREARAAGFAARWASAWWAIENGLTTEIVPEIRELHALDPGHAPTARMAAVLDRLDRPCPDPDFAAFREALGVDVRIARGPHVLLLHQHGETEAAERIDVLERVLLGFHLTFAAQGVELRVPRQRLVSAWFADQRDYRAFLHRQAADAFATTGGYFHPTWGAVVAFDARSVETRRTSTGSPRNRSPRRPGNEAARRSAMRDLDRRANDLGLAAHEMVHQLASDSGLAPRPDAFPHWLHEGFAAQFEVIRGGRWAGIGRANDLRLPDWRSQQQPARLERLVRDVGFDRGYQRDLYASAWALVFYLRARHPSEFVAFLDLLRNPVAAPESDDAAAEPHGERFHRAFCRTFGRDLAAMERDWHGFLAEIRTPTEQNAPGLRPVSATTAAAPQPSDRKAASSSN